MYKIKDKKYYIFLITTFFICSIILDAIMKVKSIKTIDMRICYSNIWLANETFDIILERLI